jgi:hypothetical protein
MHLLAAVALAGFRSRAALQLEMVMALAKADCELDLTHKGGRLDKMLEMRR